MTDLELELQRDALHWRHVAAYLASCQAATLESLPKSSRGGARRRHTEICRRAAAYLRGKETPPWYGTQSKEALIEVEIKRCEEAVAKYGA